MGRWWVRETGLRWPNLTHARYDFAFFLITIMISCCLVIIPSAVKFCSKKRWLCSMLQQFRFWIAFCIAVFNDNSSDVLLVLKEVCR